MSNASSGFFKKQNSLISIDIGSSGLRVLESNCTDNYIEILNFAYASFDEDIYQNQILAKQDIVSEKLSFIFKDKNIASRDVVAAVPGPAAFSKKISVPKMEHLEDLDSNIKFEANALIPHGLEGVYFDYALLNTDKLNADKLNSDKLDNNKTGNNIDIFIAVVKNDIVHSILSTLEKANLNLKILDIDYLAFLNLFEFNYPELKDKTVALIDIGGRYSTISVCLNGEMLFSTNIAIGGRLIAEDLSKEFKTTISEKDLVNILDLNIDSNINSNINSNIDSNKVKAETTASSDTAKLDAKANIQTDIKLEIKEEKNQEEKEQVENIKLEETQNSGLSLEDNTNTNINPKNPETDNSQIDNATNNAQTNNLSKNGLELEATKAPPIEAEKVFEETSSFETKNNLQQSFHLQLEKVANELRKQLRYYGEAGTLDAIEKVFITGGGAYWNNINDIFSKKFNVDCETFDPMKKVKFSKHINKDDVLKRSEQLAVLLGLALRREDDSKKRYGK